jgi:signal peptidase I
VQEAFQSDFTAWSWKRLVHSFRLELRRPTRNIALALCVCLAIGMCVYQPVEIEGTSMNPVLWDQERIFVNKFVYQFEPIKRGDIIVFSYPLDPSKPFIKRVVGLPGEKIEMRTGRVYINGRQLSDQYVPPSYLDVSNYPERAIPEETYFVVGDHRDGSNDSRVFGPVADTDIRGKAVFAYWPFDHFGWLPSPSPVSAASK